MGNDIKDLISKFNGIDSDLISVFNLKVGYTQGELDAVAEPDYDDGFKAGSHIFWKYSVVIDQSGETGCDWLIINWANPEQSKCVSCDEDAAEAIGEFIEPTTEDMFGSNIDAAYFQAVVLSVLDEPDGYEWIEEILEEIGGYIEVEDGDKISEDFVNSLFVLSEEIDSSLITVEDGALLVNGQALNVDEIDSDHISEKNMQHFQKMSCVDFVQQKQNINLI
jgi:hypothetical protein